MNWNAVFQMIQDRATAVGLQILGALVLYIVGRWIISLVVAAVQKTLATQHIEPTVLRFLGNALSVALNVTLVVAILAYRADLTRAGHELDLLHELGIGSPRFGEAIGSHRDRTADGDRGQVHVHWKAHAVLHEGA